MDNSREELNAMWERIRQQAQGIFAAKSPDPGPLKPTPGNPSVSTEGSSFLEMVRWLSTIKHPSVIPIIGSRGSGKSALGYKLLEYFRWQAKPYVVGLPDKIAHLLPEWIGTVPLIEDVPPGAIVLIDEAYTILHSRTSLSRDGREISKQINLSRQKDQTLIFITQEARQIDKNIVSSASLLIIKNPAPLQTEFERSEFRKILLDAQKAFAAIGKDKAKWSYVYAPEANFTGMLSSSLPTFWSTELSKAYRNTKPSEERRIPRKMSREDKIKLARELHAKGMSLGEIAHLMGTSKSTIKNYLDGYPYRKKPPFFKLG